MAEGNDDDEGGPDIWAMWNKVMKQFAVSISINVPGALIIATCLVLGMFVYYFFKPAPRERPGGWLRIHREEFRQPPGWPVGWPLGPPQRSANPYTGLNALAPKEPQP